MPPKRWIFWASVASAVLVLYFVGLDRVGMLSADEPRYAAIGREMAQTGDWVTPRLFGQPWFEKPALLYWFTAIGFKAGLGDDLAPRIPVAILSVLFLAFYFLLLRRQFGDKPAAYSTAILGTSAGWLAYSHVAVTDLPLAAFFAAAMLLVEAEAFIAAGVCLGLAVLAKGLVPLVLFLPALWFLRRRPRALLTVLGLAFVVALPWYALVTARNGSAFLYDFFWKHHFERFATAALRHVQPFWYYIPVLAAGMFPWTPALSLLFDRTMWRDPKLRFYFVWFAFGFVFFSASENKLPGYLLPLLPAVAALCGIRLAEALRATVVLVSCAVLLWFVPAIEVALPTALISGLSHTVMRLPYEALLPVVAVAVACWFLEQRGRRSMAMGLLVFCVTLSVLTVVLITYPMLDRTVSARGYFRSQQEPPQCTSSPNRSWRYGLDYYANRPIPDCK